MAIDYEKLLSRKFEDVEAVFEFRDTILYALGLGLGSDPLDRKELRYVYEDGLKALPSMCLVMAGPGFWVSEPDTGIDAVQVLHGEQSFEIHKPLLPEGTFIGKTRVTDIIDKGEGKGALLYVEKKLYEKESGDHVATSVSTTFCRGNGGFGGPQKPAPKPHGLPDTAPDVTVDLPTLERAALIYRLSGDYNPLHADPDIAAKAGYDRPILHGLCSLGVAQNAILKACCDFDGDRLKSLQLRFSSPVFPGETIRTEIWREGNVISFRCRSLERDVVVINNGRAELTN
ncbi:MAG: MaoC family dehydratase N-terminal domain-containing protein [Kordiimonadaceae bacterium]|nr:MaoC family dehydratase N-terminal domain-containing protein [Kordiimonadaceae bacterium]